MLVATATILREVTRKAQTDANAALIRVAGIDDWAWKKGMNYGTVIVDLERRQVVDVLSDRSAASTSEWLKRHPDDRSDQPRPRRTLCRGRTRRGPANAASRRPFPPAPELPRGGREATYLSGRPSEEKQRPHSLKERIADEFPRARIGILNSERSALRKFPDLLKLRLFYRSWRKHHGDRARIRARKTAC